ncbi:MAG: GNAT family N-acetyltransferase [Flavobacteriales bacterium]|nr:GNAT family N-acetyltransferase [Flavobacteriales bacterium]
MKKRIETSRLLLRPFTMDDVEASYVMEQDPDVNRYTHDGGVKTREHVEQIISKGPLKDYETYGYGRFAMELKSDGKFIGFTGLKYMQDLGRVDLGYRLTKAHWGQGLATEAGVASLQFGFEDLDLEEIIATILPENAASANVLTKLGFALEEELIMHGIPQQLYSLQRADWQTKPPHINV